MKVRILFSIVTLIAMISTWTIASEKPDTGYMARLLMEANQAKRLYPDFLGINTELDETTLYELQKKYVALQVQNGATVFRVISPACIPENQATIMLISESSDQLTSKSLHRNKKIK